MATQQVEHKAQREQVRYRTPPQLAEEARVSAEKIIGWILAGELRGVNLAKTTSGRPRYRVAESDWLEFLERRSAAVEPSTKPKRRQSAVPRRFYQ